MAHQQYMALLAASAHEQLQAGVCPALPGVVWPHAHAQTCGAVVLRVVVCTFTHNTLLAVVLWPNPGVAAPRHAPRPPHPCTPMHTCWGQCVVGPAGGDQMSQTPLTWLLECSAATHPISLWAQICNQTIGRLPQPQPTGGLAPTTLWACCATLATHNAPLGPLAWLLAGCQLPKGTCPNPLLCGKLHTLQGLLSTTGLGCAMGQGAQQVSQEQQGE